MNSASLRAKVGNSTTAPLSTTHAMTALQADRERPRRALAQASRGMQASMDSTLTSNAAVVDDKPTTLSAATASGYPGAKVSIGAGICPKERSTSKCTSDV